MLIFSASVKFGDYVKNIQIVAEFYACIEYQHR
jgi:hypothetical protein